MNILKKSGIFIGVKMKIKEQLTQDLKQSMIAGEKERRNTIRYLMAQIKNAEIKKQKELEENEIFELLLKQSQQRTESIEIYSEANRSDLVDKEKVELEIIQQYLPQQLTQEEISELVSESIKSLEITSPKEIGKLMSDVMPKLKGKASGKEINNIAMQILNSKS